MIDPPLHDRPTARELEMLRVYAETWDYRQAAARLGVPVSTFRGRIERWRRRERVTSIGALVWRYRDRLAA